MKKDEKKERTFTLTETDISRLWYLAKMAPYSGKDYLTENLKKIGFTTQTLRGTYATYKILVPKFIVKKKK